jgi:hypothetical protein
LANVKKIFSSETAWPNGAKLGIDGPWVCPTMSCSGSHLGITINIKNTKFVKDLPMIDA